MHRRDFQALAGAAATFPRVAFGQQAAKMLRIAWLATPVPDEFLQPLKQGLADAGYLNGKTITIDSFHPRAGDDRDAIGVGRVRIRR